MNLNIEQLNSLVNFSNLATTCKIEKIIIDKESMRGLDEDKSIFIKTENSIFDNDTVLCISRLNSFVKRLSTFISIDGFKIECNEASSNPNEIDLVKFSGGKTKADFRTASPSMVRIPKNVIETPQWLFSVSKDNLLEIIKGYNMIGSGCTKVILTSKSSGEIFFEFTDEEHQDLVSTKITDSAIWIPEDVDQPKQIFVHYYMSKALIQILKLATSDVIFTVGSKGMLQLTIEDTSITLIPRKN